MEHDRPLRAAMRAQIQNYLLQQNIPSRWHEAEQEIRFVTDVPDAGAEGIAQCIRLDDDFAFGYAFYTAGDGLILGHEAESFVELINSSPAGGCLRLDKTKGTLFAYWAECPGDGAFTDRQLRALTVGPARELVLCGKTALQVAMGIKTAAQAAREIYLIRLMWETCGIQKEDRNEN